MSETMVDVKSVIQSQLKASQVIVDSFVSAFTEETAFCRLSGQGESVNWVLGHLAVNENWFVGLLTGQELKEFSNAWKDIYMPDESPPVLNRENAIHFSELKDILANVRSNTFAALANFSDNDWHVEISSDAELPGVFKTKADVWGLISLHTFWHVGHLASLKAACNIT